MNWYKRIKTSNIIIDPGGMYEGELSATDESVRMRTKVEFGDDQDVYFDFDLLAFSFLQRGGMHYGNTSYLTLSSNTNKNNEIERKVMEEFYQSLSYIPQPKWQEGRNPMFNVLEEATGDIYTDKIEEINEIPGEEVKPLPSSISIGGPSIDFVFGPRPGEIDSLIRSIIMSFEKVIKPYMDNNLLSYYAINSGVYGDKIVRSERGQRFQDNADTSRNNEIGFLKYIINTVLPKYPKLYEEYSGLVNTFHPDVQPQNQIRVDLTQPGFASQFLEDSEGITKEVMEAVIKFDDNKLSRLEATYSKMEEMGVNKSALDSILFWTKEDNMEDAMEHITGMGGSLLSKEVSDPKVRELMHFMGLDSQADQIYEATNNSAIKAINNGNDYIIRNFVIPIMDNLDLPPQYVQILLDLKSQEEESVRKQKAEIAEENRIQALKIDWDGALWNLNDGTIDPVGERYDPTAFGDYIGENAESMEWLDHEALLEEAYEEAQEKAYENLEERPSSVYKDNKEDILLDIKYESDEFIEDNNLWDKLPEEPSDEQMVNFVKSKYYNDFIEWKIPKMIEDEDEESWRYDSENVEVEPEDIQEKINDLAEDYAIDSGIAFVEMEWDKNVLSIITTSKFLDKARAMAAEIMKINIPTGDKMVDERFPIMDSTQITVYLSDEKKTINLGYGRDLKQDSSINWYKKALFCS